jgi:allantoinase
MSTAPERLTSVDHAHYDWSPIAGRARIRWPKDARLALCVMVTLEYFETEPPAGTHHANDMPSFAGWRPNPDIPTLSHREYGHRVGVFRVLDAIKEHGITPMVAIDAMTAEKYPFLVDYCARRDCEFVAHGMSVTQIITNAMSPTTEARYIKESLDRIEGAVGSRPAGWFSPERSESERTPQLLAAAGVRYLCDWSNDDQPYRLNSPGDELFALPTSLELDDAYALLRRGVPLSSYSTMLRDSVDELLREGDASGRLLVLNVHPWVTGQPFRIGLWEGALDYILERDGIWPTTGAQVIDLYATNMAANSESR